MRRTPVVPAILMVVAPAMASPAYAQSIDREAAQDSAQVVDRVTRRSADLMIVTRTGDAALALVGRDLLLQLTDEGLELRAKDSDQDQEKSLLSEIIGSMARAGLRRLLDNAVAYPVDGIRRAEWEDGRLVLEGSEGPLFDITLNDRDVMTDFHPADARRLVREIRRLQDP